MKHDPHARLRRRAVFRFYEELNDFLPVGRRKVAFEHDFFGTPALLDVIQAIGVPHGAVDLILVDGRAVDFGYRLHGGERVAVYPMFERLDVGPVSPLRRRPLRRTRFLLDVHLGKLARILRLLGFDSAWDAAWDDEAIIRRSLSERRVILTRDLGILKQRRVTHGYWLRNQEPEAQAAEVIDALDLRSRVQPFTRCLECNDEIHTVDAADVCNEVPPGVLRRFDDFRRCGGCGRVYWRGSHYDRMRERIRCLLNP
jgi:uncharacterized protein with PIN domain